MDRNEPVRLSAALGMGDLAFTAQTFGGGGNGAGAAVTLADAAITAGYARCVVVFRSLAQGQFDRYGQAGGPRRSRGRARSRCRTACQSPAQICAMQTQRFMHDHGVTPGQPGRGRPRLLRPRPAQPAGDPVRYSPLTPRRIPRLTVDRRAVPPLRLLPGERRRRGDRRHDARAGAATSRQAAGRDRGRRARARATRRCRRFNETGLPHARITARRASSCGSGPA